MSPVHAPAGDPAVLADDLAVHAFGIPVDDPDGMAQDGTLTWESATIIPVEATVGGRFGLR